VQIERERPFHLIISREEKEEMAIKKGGGVPALSILLLP